MPKEKEDYGLISGFVSSTRTAKRPRKIFMIGYQD
jgi:hypothetical protein